MQNKTRKNNITKGKEEKLKRKNRDFENVSVAWAAHDTLTKECFLGSDQAKLENIVKQWKSVEKAVDQARNL